MKIKILHLIDGAKQAKGLTVIIDVFRAFTTACYVFDNGAKEIIPFADIDIAYKLKAKNPGFLLIGERDGKKQPGFDYGNSPTEIEKVDFSNKTVIQTTSAGTQGLVHAKKADEIITGSFVNVQAVIDYIKNENPDILSLVAMGTSGVVSSDEDKFCAEYIKNSLENKPNDFTKIKRQLNNSKNARKFFDPKLNWAPKKDFDLCLYLDRFDFVLKTEYNDNNQLILKRIF
jgi:2-phosphosulfolactate phosphatase